jgi:hypothetical protein
VFRDGRNLSVFQRNMLPPSSRWKSEDGDSTFPHNVRKFLEDYVATYPRTLFFSTVTTERIPNVRNGKIMVFWDVTPCNLWVLIICLCLQRILIPSLFVLRPLCPFPIITSFLLILICL